MKFTLLVIDDEKNIREGLAADFEMDGYDVKIAANGDEGLESLSKGDIDRFENAGNKRRGRLKKSNTRNAGNSCNCFDRPRFN